MNLDFTPEEKRFRDEVRSFLREHLPARIDQRKLSIFGGSKELQRENITKTILGL